MGVHQELGLIFCAAAMLLVVLARAVHVAELPAVWHGRHVRVLACPFSRHHRPDSLLSCSNSLSQKPGVVALF